MSDAQQIASGNHDERVRAYVEALQRENAALRKENEALHKTLSAAIDAARAKEGQL